MKILHLANVVGEFKGGGIHEVVANLYKNQKELLHEPHVWYPGHYEDANSIRTDGNVLGMPTYGNSKYGIIKNLFHRIKATETKYDLIHQHGIWMPMSILSHKISKKFQINTIIQPHGFLESYSRNLSKFKKQVAYFLYEKSNLSNAYVLIACSDSEAKTLKTLFPYKSVAIIPNGVSSDFYDIPFVINSKVSEKKIMLFLSNIIPVKGIERLLNAIDKVGHDKLNNWELLIAGYVSANYKKTLLKRIVELDLANFVRFVGPKFGKDKIDIFDSASVFVLPSFSENFGIVVPEALSRKIPVMATKGSPWEELNTKNCGFWVDNNESGIENGILKILETSDQELNDMGIRGRNLVGNKYLWKQSTLKTIELYKWIINGGNRPDFII